MFNRGAVPDRRDPELASPMFNRIKDACMSTSCFDREDETFIVLVNHEEQYSIWPHWKAVPGGWTAVEGVKGDKKTVLDYVDATWTDMRPKSLRVWMQQQDQAGSGAARHKADTDTDTETAAG
ncbi:MbtH protein [Delftia acidovorans CCUG 15835]|nr:MbtH protein [Delftia acidovorans CCUG 15835]